MMSCGPRWRLCSTARVLVYLHVSFAGIYGATGPATGADGKLTVTVPALSSVVYRAAKPIAQPGKAPTVEVKAPGALVPTRTELTATTTGDPLSTVTFAAQVDFKHTAGVFRGVLTAPEPVPSPCGSRQLRRG